MDSTCRMECMGLPEKVTSESISKNCEDNDSNVDRPSYNSNDDENKTSNC